MNLVLLFSCLEAISRSTRCQQNTELGRVPFEEPPAPVTNAAECLQGADVLSVRHALFENK